VPVKVAPTPILSRIDLICINNNQIAIFGARASTHL
jgi:hypothetical protein